MDGRDSAGGLLVDDRAPAGYAHGFVGGAWREKGRRGERGRKKDFVQWD